MDEYLAYLETFWNYFPYVFYAFVLLTFLPKSLRKIKKFADADYEANRNKYHRCYGPDHCCHNLIEHEDAPKAKSRKPVTRGYLRKQQQNAAQQLRSHSIAEDTLQPTAIAIKRQVPVSAIQTNTNVNQIAKMFECGSGGMAHKKINRVLPEIRTTMHNGNSSQQHHHHHHTTDEDDDGCLDALKTAHSAQLQRLHGENIENSLNLLHQQNSTTKSSNVDDDEHWQSSTLSSLPRRTRAVPNTLTYAGTSATPSTASPAASSSPHSSPSPPNSPVLRTAPILNLKTSVEDIFAAIARSAEKIEENYIKYAGCNTLSPVTSIDDILSQRRLSRPLSAYSISDLLNDEANFFNMPSTTATETTSLITAEQMITEDHQQNQDEHLQQTNINNEKNIFNDSFLVPALD